MAGIVDVAAAAGVSPTTVSHVLNNRGRIAEQTRAKVLKAARQLGYQANVHAQQLVTRRSRIIAIQMPHLGQTGGPSLPHSAYFLDVINGAAAAADHLGYALVVSPSGGRAGILNGFSIDGAIIVDPQADEPAFEASVPVVVIGASEETGDVLWVDNDHVAAARVALDHFAGAGRRRPALLTDRTRRPYVNDVVTGYRTWVAEHDIAETIVAVGSPEDSAWYDELARLLAAPIDAVYTSSDDLALALLDAASRSGVRVPDDLAIASAVDGRPLTLTSPQISATNLFPFRTGETAATLLIEHLEVESESLPGKLIPTEFLVRASSSPTS
ncbi:LacI family DNA-binding transcriptional regulator [Mycobacterium sp. SMC-4]|uniref:LacI family DNA-binding transcriptional regulator n=1 Tax=Mycobacterium sp. SMC-4 TaxID=2857059 RepID=UPI003D0827F0